MTQRPTKERPILFSGEMVRAILVGCKTQTRRALSQQPLEILTKRPPWEHTVTRQWNGCKVWFALMQRNPNRGTAFRCKYGEVGSRLWVRETWATAAAWDKQKPSDLLKTTPIYYHADKSHGSLVRWYDEDEELGRLRPSIFMCRGISRITLEITSVRVERLNDISEADAKAEGCSNIVPLGSDYVMRDYKTSYKQLWKSINGTKSWWANPWVWVIEFKRI